MSMVDTVVVLNDYCLVQGGASKVAIDEAVALATSGLRVVFLGAVGPVGAALRTSPVEVVCLDQAELVDVTRRPGVALQGLYNAGARAAAARILRDCRPQSTVVHLHGYTKALTAGPMRTAARLGFSTVCTLHDFFAACPNGAFYDYREEDICHRTALGSACLSTNCDKRQVAHKAYRVLRAVAQRHLSDFPATVRDYITLSHGSADILRPYLPANATLSPLENIIEAEPSEAVPVAGNRELVVVGRLDTEKGVELAAEAARAAGLPITFVGEGPLRPRLEAAGARVTGWVTPQEVQSRLRRARALLFPSRWYETYGLVVSEAAALGVPAIVSDVSAAAERVEDGVTGWRFRSGDLGDLTRCVLAAGDDTVLAAAGRAAHARFWADPPTAQRHVAGLRSIYDDILRRRALRQAA